MWRRSVLSGLQSLVSGVRVGNGVSVGSGVRVWVVASECGQRHQGGQSVESIKEIVRNLEVAGVNSIPLDMIGP